MSAPPPVLPATLSTSGYEDGLGRRSLGFDRESGSVLERLVVRPELVAFERALRQRAERLGTFEDERVARLRDIEHDRQAGTLTIVSEFVAGRRLSDLLDEAPERAGNERAVATVDVALGFLLQVLPALSALHAAAGMTHGAVGDGRIVISPAGQVVLLDAIYGPALERLQLSRRRLWTEFRIAAPPSAGPARFDVAGDLSQAALAAVAMTIGRPLVESDYPEGLRALLDETVEIAQLRGSARFASAFQRFFERALPLPSRRIYATADEAAAAVQDLVTAEMGVERCRTALIAVVRDSEAAVPSPAATVEESVAACDEPCPIATELAPPAVAIQPDVAPEVVLPVAAPEVEPPVVAPAPQPEMDAPLAATPGSEPEPVIEEPVYEPVEAAAVMEAPLATAPASEPEPVMEGPVYEPVEAAVAMDVPLAAAPAPEPEPVIEEPAHEPAAAAEDEFRAVAPAPEFEPVSETPTDEPVEAAAMAAPLAAAPAPEPEPVIQEPPDEPVQAAAPAATPDRRKRQRGGRRFRDRLRSTHIAAPPPPAATPPAPPVRMPVIAAPSPPPPPSVRPQPLRLPQPLWTPPEANAPLEPLAASPTVAPQPRTVRIKAEAVSAYAAPRAIEQFEAATAYRGPVVRAAQPPASTLPWKLAAAAAIAIMAGVSAGRAKLFDRPPDPVPAAAKPAAVPVEVPVSPTGSIAVETEPSGARVLIDGQPAGETPLKVDTVGTGSHIITLITPTTTLKRSVKVEAGKTTSIDVPVYSGWLAVFAPIALEITEHGRSVGSTEQGRLMLPPGRHSLTFANKDLGYSIVRRVDVESGEERALTLDPRGTININAVPWAEVYIDGQRAGETPLANFQVPLGTRDILFKHPQFGERRMSTVVTASAPAAVSVDYTK